MIEKAVPGVSGIALARFAQRARKAAGLRGRVNVLLTSSREVRLLNRTFRGKDRPTDVLSFPALPEADANLAGDIVISAETACANARHYGHAAAQEVKILVLHGVLHLAGYDHESDQGQMARSEERLRRELGLGKGLIRRTQTESRQSVPASSTGRRRSQPRRADDRRPTTADRRSRSR